jgi:hypothetical protein
VAPSIRKSWQSLRNKRRSLGRHSSLADSDHGVFFIISFNINFMLPSPISWTLPFEFFNLFFAVILFYWSHYSNLLLLYMYGVSLLYLQSFQFTIHFSLLGKGTAFQFPTLTTTGSLLAPWYIQVRLFWRYRTQFILLQSHCFVFSPRPSTLKKEVGSSFETLIPIYRNYTVPHLRRY